MVDDLPVVPDSRRQPTRRSRPRMISCFRRGVLLIVATLIATGTLPPSAVVPEPWPQTLDSLPYPVHRNRPLHKAVA